MSKWDERYSKVEDAFGIGANSFLKSQLELPNSGLLSHHLKRNNKVPNKVLCIAAGQGRNALYLAKQGFEVTALDISKVGLEQLAQTAQEQELSLTTLYGNIENINLGANKWDIITCFFMHTPLTTRKALYKKVPDALNEGGQFIFESFSLKQLELKKQNEGSIGGPSTPELFPTVEELSSELENLDIQHLVEAERELEPSPFHKGKAAVIQLIAKKLKAKK